MAPAMSHGLSVGVLEELERLAVEVATEAGRLIVEQRPAGLGVEKTKSSATDVVTVMDQRAQDLIRTRLRAARPDDGFLGEEEGGAAATSELTWVVDPIDGTVNYRARLGGGAWSSVGDQPAVRLAVTEQPELSQALVGTGFGYEASVRRWQALVLLRVLGEIRDIRRFGSAALDLCHVATGTLDAYFERGLNPWDLAAAWLVVTEAGGRVTGLGGEAPGSAMVVAAAQSLLPSLDTVLSDAVSAADADTGPGQP